MLRHRRSHRDPKLELAPLLDIIFILLLFFAVSSTLISQHQGIKLDLPVAETVTQEKKGYVLSITHQNKLLFDKKYVSLTELTAELTRIIKQDPTAQVILQAHETAPYALIISALDHVRLGGCYDIVLEAKRKV